MNSNFCAELSTSVPAFARLVEPLLGVQAAQLFSQHFGSYFKDGPGLLDHRFHLRILEWASDVEHLTGASVADSTIDSIERRAVEFFSEQNAQHSKTHR